MKSPFPGMDPFIEASGLWEEFHNHCLEKIYETLADTLPEMYVVKTPTRSFVELVEITEGCREKFVEVFEPAEEGLRLVTCLEVLSPANKRKGSPGWKQYLRKRQALLLGEANFVAIDLLRGGHRMPMLDPWPDSPCTLLVCRQERAPYCTVYPAHALEPLRVLPIPVSPPDPDAALPLQSLVEAVYVRGRFHRLIDYAKPTRPALLPEEAAWLQQHLPTRSP